jgi:hypothetical protein
MDMGRANANTAAALDDVASWCAKGVASRFENGRATTLVELAINAVALAGGQAALWLSRISALQPSQMAGQPARRQAVLGAVPGLSVDTHTFMDKVLTENQRKAVLMNATTTAVQATATCRVVGDAARPWNFDVPPPRFPRR